MTRIRDLSLAALVGLLACAAPVLAQDTTAPAADPPAATAADSLSMGTDPNAPVGLPGPDTATVGQTYLAAKFELWEQRCVKTDTGKDPCQFYQLLKDKDGNSVAEISMLALPASTQAAAGATVMAPLQTFLPAGMLLSIDGANAKTYPFTFCTTAGCIARIGFTAEEVARFKKGAGAAMTIVPAAAPDQKVELVISLKGFTAGYDAVAAANADNK